MLVKDMKDLPDELAGGILTNILGDRRQLHAGIVDLPDIEFRKQHITVEAGQAAYNHDIERLNRYERCAKTEKLLPSLLPGFRMRRKASLQGSCRVTVGLLILVIFGCGESLDAPHAVAYRFCRIFGTSRRRRTQYRPCLRDRHGEHGRDDRAQG